MLVPRGVRRAAAHRVRRCGARRALLGGVFFGLGGGRGRLPPDATIGATYAVAAAAGILLIAKAATGEAHDIFLQGNILGITRRDMWVLLGVSVPVLLVHVVFYKEFLFVFNFLVIPAVTGLLLGRSMASTFAWSIGSALVAAFVGFSLSVPLDLPS